VKPVCNHIRTNSILTLALCALLFSAIGVYAQSDPLPSWNDGPAKKAIIEFVQATTDKENPKFVPVQARIATFDQDGTTWVEQPMYTQIAYCLEQVKVLAEKKPELKNVEPFKTVLSGDRAAMAKLTNKDLEKILAATLTGMTVEEFNTGVKNGRGEEEWLGSHKHEERLEEGLCLRAIAWRFQRCHGNSTGRFDCAWLRWNWDRGGGRFLR
jgi:hypothetical protein